MAEAVTNTFSVTLAIGLGTATVLLLAYVVLGGKNSKQPPLETVSVVKAKKVISRTLTSKINPGKENSGAISSKKTSTVAKKTSGTNILTEKTNGAEKEGTEGTKKSSKRRGNKKSKGGSVESLNAAEPAKPSSEVSESDEEEFTVVTASSSVFGPGRFDLLSTENVTVEKTVRKASESKKRKETKAVQAPTVVTEVQTENTNDVDSDSFVAVGGKAKKKKKKKTASASNLGTPPVVVDPVVDEVVPVDIPVASSKTPEFDVAQVPSEEKSGKKKRSKKKTTALDAQESPQPSIESPGRASRVEATKGKEEGEFETVTKKTKKSKKSSNPIDDGSVESDASASAVKESTEQTAVPSEIEKFKEISVPVESEGKDKKKKKNKEKAGAVSYSVSNPSPSQAPSSSMSSSAGFSHPSSSATSSEASRPSSSATSSESSRPPSSSANSNSTSSSSQALPKAKARPQASRASQMAFLIDAFPTISVDVISGVLAEHDGSIEETMVALISRDSFVSSASLYTPSANKKPQRPAVDEESKGPETLREESESESSEEEEEVDGWKVEKKKGKKGRKEVVSSSDADEEEKSRVTKSGKKVNNVTVTGGSSNSFLSLLEMEESEEESSESEESEESEKEVKKTKSRKGRTRGRK